MKNRGMRLKTLFGVLVSLSGAIGAFTGIVLSLKHGDPLLLFAVFIICPVAIVGGMEITTKYIGS